MWEDSAKWQEFERVANLDAQQVKMLRERLMSNRQLRLAATFAEYAATSLPHDFFDMEWRDWFPYTPKESDTAVYHPSSQILKVRDLIPQDPVALRKALRASYTARSKIVHVGEHAIDFGIAVNARSASQRPKPLSFAALRTLLKALIHQELMRHEPQAALPQVE